jgi:hypothetical protein
MGEITIGWFWVFLPLVPAVVIWIFAWTFIISIFSSAFKK